MPVRFASRLRKHRASVVASLPPFLATGSGAASSPSFTGTLTAIAPQFVANGAGAFSTGTSSPSLGSQNFNFATRSPTAASSVLDLREDFSTGGRENVLWVSNTGAFLVRAATYTYMPSGGYYGQGCGRFVPGYFTGDSNDPLGQHIAGLGQFVNFQDVGDCRIVTIGILWRFGSGWLSEQNGHKCCILLRQGAVRRDNGQVRNTRPMVIPKGVYSGSGTLVLPPCDGTLCNADANYRPAGELNYFNDPPVAQPNINIKYTQWLWSEISVDVLQDPGIMHTRMWSADGTYNGTQILRNYLWEDIGGEIWALDNINFCNSVASPTANCWMEIERVEIHVGAFGPISPPTGFVGSLR